MDKYKVPSTLHIEQARRLVEMIEQRGEGGHESLMAIVTELKRFGSGEVSFDPDLISPFAVKEEIENGWKAVEQEIEALYSHLKAMIDEVEGTKRTNDEMTQKMQKQFAVIQNLYTDAQAVIDAKERIRTSSEFFLSDQNIDYDRIAGEPLQVRGGSVALPYATEPVVLNANVRATIVPGTYTDGYGILGTESNGFPGNNHEVRKNAAQGLSTESGMNGMTFIGETDRAADLSAILDANEESRFEYERVYMRPTEQELIARGKGLDYEVTDGKRIPYLGEEEPLRLSILLTLDKARWVNEIDIRPFIPTNYGAKAPLVKDILIGKEYEPPVSVLKKEPVANEWVFRFKPVFATTVIIQLVQDTAYPTDLGHIAYELVKESEGQRLTIDNADKTLAPTKPIVVDGPAIPVSDMGFKVEQGNDGLKVSYASQGVGELRAKTMTETLRRLQDAINPKERRVALYRVEGARKVIGIRDILVKEAVYLDKGELVTKPIHFDEPLTRVTLEADATPERNEAGVEIRYHVSVDDGVEWHEIQPMNSELGDAPKMYRIVQDDSDVEPEVPVIRTSRDVYEVRFKMTMERVGVSGQSGPTKVPDTPELFMYRMLAETKPKTRASKTPQILPPQRLKGNVIGGGGKVEDTGGQGPSFEVMPAPALTLEVSKESCNNVPMKVTTSFTHDKPVIEAVVYLDGKEVYREQPGVSQKTIDVDVPTSYFAERSRVSVSVTISDGIKDARQLKSVLVVPCQDAGGRDIDISAGYPEVGQPWTVSGFARSTTDIDKVTLYINGTSYPVENLGLVWREKERVEFIKVFSPEEVEAMGFTVGQSIELKWVAKDVQAQEWDDILVLQYVDRRPPTIDCGQVTYLGVTYYDWNLGGFQTKGISVPNWDQEVKSFDDGRGIKTLIGWNELMAAPVLMVRSGIGETGGVIIGQIELRYRKLVDGSLSSQETTVFMEGSLESDMTEAVDLAYGQKDLSQMAATIKRTGRFTGMPRLMGLNAYLVPDFGDEYRANVCGVGITQHSFEPTDNILLPGTVEGTGAACESNTMFLIEYYDKTLGRRVLHGQKRDGNSPQATIFLPDVEEHEVVLKWSDTKTGVAVLTKSANTKGLVVTALGVLVRSAKMEARYGIGYIESVGYQPEDQTFAVRKPSDPLEVGDLYADGEPVPELTGVDAKLFLSVKPRDMIACAVDPDDPGVKQDEQPPTIEASTTLLPKEEGVYCINDVPDTGLPVMIEIYDDVSLESYEIFHENIKIEGAEGLNQSNVVLSQKLQFDRLKYYQDTASMGKADIIFSMDTSGSMSPYIEKVKQKVNEFKSFLVENQVDAYIGVVDSLGSAQMMVPLGPASSLDMSSVSVNGGGWEANNWAQVTGLSDEFMTGRSDAKKVIVLVTDTYVGQENASIPPNVLDYVRQNDIQVSALALPKDQQQYSELTSATDGVFLDMSGDPDMSALASGIGKVAGTGELLTVIATDKSGKTTSKSFRYNFKDCQKPQAMTIETLEFKPVEGNPIVGSMQNGMVPFSVIDANDIFPFTYTARSLTPMISTLVVSATFDARSGSGPVTYLENTKVTRNSETFVTEATVNVPIRKSWQARETGHQLGIPKKKANVLYVFDQKTRNKNTLDNAAAIEQGAKMVFNNLITRGVPVSDYYFSIYDRRAYKSPVYNPGFEFNVATLTIGDELEFSQLMGPDEIDFSHIKEDPNAKWEEVGLREVFTRSGGILDWAQANAMTGEGLEGGITRVIFQGATLIDKEGEHVGGGLAEIENKKAFLKELYARGIIVNQYYYGGIETQERMDKFSIPLEAKYDNIHSYERELVEGSTREDEYRVYSKDYKYTGTSGYWGPSVISNTTWEREPQLDRVVPFMYSVKKGGIHVFNVTGDVQGYDYNHIIQSGVKFMIKTVDDIVMPYLKFEEE